MERKNTSINARGRAAFTLVELMVAMALSLVVAAAIGSFAWFSSRSFVTMTDYTEMNQRSQFALDKMSLDIRQSRSLTAFTNNSLTFAKADGTPLQFTYSPSAKRLVRVTGGQTTTLLNDCDDLQFWIYQHTVISNTFACYDPASVTNARVIQMTWRCSRKILGKKATTEDMTSAQIALRNR